jgi:hypothetical protein
MIERNLRRRGLQGDVPARDGLPRAHDSGAARGRGHGGDLRLDPPLPRLPRLSLRRDQARACCRRTRPSRSTRRSTTGCNSTTSGPARKSRPACSARVRRLRGSGRQGPQIIAVPAERYIGNEDARGGFGALQYPDVLGQVYDRIVETGGFDPAHPPFFLLHSDGDNHGGGADSYYKHNTGRLVEWLQQDPASSSPRSRTICSASRPTPPRWRTSSRAAWSGADNGDPQFMKWFSRYDQPYSPDLNSWAVLTALQNRDPRPGGRGPERRELAEALRLLLTAETSCYWYWTGQPNGTGRSPMRRTGALDLIARPSMPWSGRRWDRTGPTIFPPWVTPENPGGKRWGQGCLLDAPRQGSCIPSSRHVPASSG